jgi:hypothetical protein
MRFDREHWWLQKIHPNRDSKSDELQHQSHFDNEDYRQGLHLQ